MGLRILASFILLFSVVFLPFFVSVILALVFMAYFALFFEAILILFMSDLIFGVKEMRFSYEPVVVLVVTVFVFILFEFIKKKLKFYPN